VTGGYIQVFIDGAARRQGSGQPTDAACACVVYRNRIEMVRFARPLGSVTNNAAEYEALISALLCCSMNDYARPVIYSDSAVVVNLTTGKWQLRAENLLPYYMTVREIQKEYNFDIRQVPRAKVWLPDQLCNIALDELENERKNLRLISKVGTKNV